MKKVLFLLCVLVFNGQFFLSYADDAPLDNPTAELTRQAGYQSMDVELSKNFYRTEYREEWHSHAHHGDHHPGHEPSTWYENYEEQERYCHEVEYWENEPYYDYETYWDWEYYWDQERYQERVCETRTIYEEKNVCREVWVIENGERKLRKICERQQVPRQVEECRMEWRTRPIQRQRWVQMTRRVLRYRQVQKVRCDWRYRTVVKQRLVTFTDSHAHQVPHQVFDHQVKKHVTVLFPQESVLGSSQRERLVLSFSGERVSAQVESQHYVYRELDREENEDELTIRLELGELDREEYGRASISGLRLEGEGKETRLLFLDEKPFYNVETTYHLQIRDDQDRLVVDGEIPLSEATTPPLRAFSLPLIPGQGSMGGAVKEILQGYIDYRLTLSVIRRSAMFGESAELSFSVDAFRRGVLDNALFGKQSVPDVRLVYRNNAVYLNITDKVAGHPRVNTHYWVRIQRKTWLVGTHVVARGDWSSDGDKELSLLLASGADNAIAKGLREKLDPQTEYEVTLRVHRTSPLLTGGQVAFEINKEMRAK